MPLVRLPFKNLTISRQAVFLGCHTGASMTETWCRFSPNLNIMHYRESLSEEKKTQLDDRMPKLQRQAISNRLHSCSEFCGEVSAWRDVFGLIVDDKGLRMNKRPYEFAREYDDGRLEVQTRIPDATLGLKSYDAYDLKRGYICTATDCKDDHSTQQPDKRLSQTLLQSMMNNSACGLIVDGVWGKADILFPFAVFEVKKRAVKYEEAENRIYHACKVYLAVLDDLARNPNNVAEYQTKDSDKYQLFAFTSCGSQWQVFSAWKLGNDCIHDYAIRQHGDFVMKHLDAWYTRDNTFKKEFEILVGDNEDLDTDMDSSFGLDDTDLVNLGKENLNLNEYGDAGPSINLVDSDDVTLDLRERVPEWFRLGEEARISRNDKAQSARARNRQMGEDAAKIGELNKPVEPKRKPGRPPKNGVAKKEARKKRGRGRGRPPKATSGKAIKEVDRSFPPMTRNATRSAQL
ncbi:hypothetical protein BKA56DRAFT_689582 [Ilyonectria sp. MPI-CAGE-AT-0026]|nr:hypothetical protein BKA56DRAFT_689582 [Ilyonectria sp. MPI-CAGE-AT-0026]